MRLVILNFENLKLEVPEVASRVRIEGQEAEYVVLRVDEKRQVADLLRLTGIHQVLEDVPWHALRVLRHYPYETKHVA